MNSWQTAISIAASFFCIAYFVPYIFTILKGQTRPSRATWWIWVVITTILCISYTLTGAGITVWAFVCAGIGQLTIAILSIKYGEGGWTRLDRLCFLGAGISLLLWWYFNSPLIAILFNIAVDILAVLPTLQKTYYEPEKEDLLSWFLYAMGSCLNLFTIQKLSIDILALPIYVFGVNIVMVILILRPKAKAYWQTKHKVKRRMVRRKYLDYILINSKRS